jgi:hypothetical protein
MYLLSHPCMAAEREREREREITIIATTRQHIRLLEVGVEYSSKSVSRNSRPVAIIGIN